MGGKRIFNKWFYIIWISLSEKKRFFASTSSLIKRNQSYINWSSVWKTQNKPLRRKRRIISTPWDKVLTFKQDEKSLTIKKDID